MSQTEKILSQLPGEVLGGLRQADRLWENLRSPKAISCLPHPSVVYQDSHLLGDRDTEVVVSGGTLGIIIACALQCRGIAVTVIERGQLRGRIQEWNISRRELEVLLELDLLTPAQLEAAIATEYNPARISFPGSQEIWVQDILNIGIAPITLLETLKQRFLQAGGNLLEYTPFQQVTIHPDGIVVQAGNHPIKARLLLDAMGHFSPLMQSARSGKKPDAICLVVGSCAQGYTHNNTGDLFVSFTPPLHQCQYFWEAFPAADGRTTYLFTYLDAHPDRFSLEFLYEEYLRLLPEYQQVSLTDLKFQRALFGVFPCYQNSPLQPPGDRLLPIGDSSGSQSPLSFGGFGAMIRHLKRLTLGIEEALNIDALQQQPLSLLQPYQPSLSVTWLFQRSMSLPIQSGTSAEFSVPPNLLLSHVFDIMAKSGEEVLRPFLQDIVPFPGLTQTLLKTWLTQPGLVLKIIPQVGLPTLLNWMIHYHNLASYSLLDRLGKSVEPYLKFLSPQSTYLYHRWLDAWHYGSGRDYR